MPSYIEGIRERAVNIFGQVTSTELPISQFGSFWHCAAHAKYSQGLH